MGKNKNNPKNAYYYFMLDFKKGRTVSMAEAAELASPFWKQLSADERKPYEERAKQDKNGKRVIKYTTSGTQISVVERQEKEREIQQMNVREEIKQTIRNAVEGGTITDQPFYIIHVNYFCYCSPNIYVPAELAVCRFTLQNGVTPEDVFHIIIKPGKIPLGYTFDARKHAEETHQLVIPDEDEPNNLNETIHNLLKFLGMQNMRNTSLPPLYTMENNMPVAESVLQNLCTTYCYDEGLFKIYPLEHMYFELRNSVSNSGPAYTTISFSKIELQKDVYDFCKSIPCNYHQISDVRNYCSRSFVIRLAYIICDNCCADLDIQLIPGQHIPTDSMISASRPISRTSKWSSSQTTENETYQSDLSEVDIFSNADTDDMDNYSIPDSTDSHTVANDTDDNKETEWTSYRSRNKRGARNTPRTQSSLSFTQDLSTGSKETVRRPRQFSAALTGVFPSSSSFTPIDVSDNLSIPSTAVPSEAGSIADTYRSSRVGTPPSPRSVSSTGEASSNWSIKSSPPKRIGGALPLVSGRGRGKALQGFKR